MAIDYNVDILGLYPTKIANDADYQSPGTYGLPTGFGSRTLTGGTTVVAGSGYTLGQLLTVSGGTRTVPATVTVATLNGSGVATIRVNNPGVYTVLPTNPVAVATGAFTFNATWGGQASQRVNSMVSMLVSYIAQCDNAREVKMLQEVLGRMMSEMRLGSPKTWSGSAASLKAKAAAMNFLAKAPSIPKAKDM